MKMRGIKSEERMKTWLILNRLFDADKIEPLTPLDMAVEELISTQTLSVNEFVYIF